MGRHRKKPYFDSSTALQEQIQDAGRFSALHQVVKCNASQAALLKFVLPELLPDCSRVLYLDGDILVKRDLTELYNTELEDNYVGGVLNSFTFYRKHLSFEDKVENYFNSGVMVLNLQLMRKDNITEKLIETKAKMGYTLMDQIALNYVFDKRIYLLPVRYNYQILGLPGTNNDKEIQTLNKHYGTQYSNLEDLLADTVIVHFAGRAKPWNTPTTPLSKEWYLTYLRSPVSEKLPPLSWLFKVELEREIKKIRNSWAYRVGYIITWLPDKIFTGIYSLKHNGLIYTWYRLLIYLHLKKEQDVCE